MIRNRICTHFLAQTTGLRPGPPWPSRLTALSVEPADPLLDIRWEKVRIIRAAIAGRRYDVDARLDDLLDDPPEELALLAAG